MSKNVFERFPAMLITRRSLASLLSASIVFPAFAQTKDGNTNSLRIGIIGSGSLGGTVGKLWVRTGHEVMFSSRHPDELLSVIRDLGPRASAGTPRRAAEFGSVVLFAVPYEALAGLGRDLQDPLRGKIVLDATNPSLSASNAMSLEALANGVGETSATYLPGTRLVRAFSATDASAIQGRSGQQTDKVAIPIAGNDPEAVQTAVRLVRDAGCDPLVVGNLAAARSFQQGGPGFRANTTLPDLRRRLGLPDGA